MLQQIGKLNIKLTLAIGAILIIFMIGDMTFSIYSTRQTSLKEIQRWSVLLAETVRVSMNTLMKEGKMDARFEMFDAIRLEIKGLEKVRVIRSPKVNQIFQKTKPVRIQITKPMAALVVRVVLRLNPSIEKVVRSRR